jgi:5,10-methylenetetrahydromethanopterin reductase
MTYIGAQAPKVLKLADEIGDGVLINASRPTDFKIAVEYIKEGAESTGKDPKRTDIAAWTCFSIDHEDAEKARRKAKEIVAFIVASCLHEILKRHNIEPIEAKKIGDALLKQDLRGAFEIVTDEMVDSFSISGKPEHCLKRINELISRGVTQLIIGSPYGTVTKKEAIESINREIMGRV